MIDSLNNSVNSLGMRKNSNPLIIPLQPIINTKAVNIDEAEMILNMNMIIANVSKLPDVKVGDEVVIIGKQGSQQLSVASFSELSNQVNYELLTRLPEKITRLKN